MSHTIMFHVGRSGSTVLGDMLGQHPQVHWDGEIYEPVLRASGKNPGLRLQAGAAQPLALLKARMARTPKPIYGFEVKFFHLRWFGATVEDYVDGIERLGVRRFILLRRRNTFRKVVSSLVAHRNNRFHIQARQQAEATRITIDVDRVEIDRDAKPLIAFLEDYDTCFADLAGLLSGKATLDLAYEEDVLPDPAQGYVRACRFLGVDEQTPAVRYGRTTPFPLRDIVSNLDDVKRALGGTRFAWMLDDG